MLMAALGIPPKRAGRMGRAPERFDCGKHGRLSRPEIARIAGISYRAVVVRQEAGWTGEQLCMPIGIRPNQKIGEIRYPTMLHAARLAHHFRDHVPSVKELRAFRPMSAQAAQKWRLALMKAQAEAKA